MNHNAIIASTWSDERAKELQNWIDAQPEQDRCLFVRGGSWRNGYTTFVMLPDCSTEGCDESDKGDALRQRFIERLKVDEYDDGSSPWNWVEVGFGEYGQKVLSGNCKNCFNDAEYAA